MLGKEQKERQSPRLFQLGVIPALRVIADWNTELGAAEIIRRRPFLEDFGSANPILFEFCTRQTEHFIRNDPMLAPIWSEATELTYAVINQTSRERGTQMPLATHEDIDRTLSFLAVEPQDIEKKLSHISSFDPILQDIFGKVEVDFYTRNLRSTAVWFEQHRAFTYGAIAAIYIPLRIAASRG